MKKNVLITGSAGFIGFHLTKKLIELFYNVIGIDNINSYYDVNLKLARLKELGILENSIDFGLPYKSSFQNFVFYRLDLENDKSISQIFESSKIDYVINLAAQAGVRYSLTNPKAYLKSNIEGFHVILDNCKKYKIKHLLYASSSSVYGLNGKTPFSTDDNVDHPISLYAATKKSNELFAHTYSHLYNLPTTGLRFFTVYGPWGRPDMALFLFTKAIIEGNKFEVYNNGDMIRDFTYIDDIIESLVRILEKPPTFNNNWDPLNKSISTSSAPYKIYNIGNNSPVKLMDFINELKSVLNKEVKINFKPIQQGDVKMTFANVDPLIDKINFKPSTSFKDGIKSFVKWYRKFYSI